MAMKDYSEEFRADAGALYESTPGATYKSIAADLGINRATLREWVLWDRERRGAGPDGRAGARKAPAGSGQTAPAADPDERIRQLEARVAELEASASQFRRHPIVQQIPEMTHQPSAATSSPSSGVPSSGIAPIDAVPGSACSGSSYGRAYSTVSDARCRASGSPKASV